MSFGPEVRSTQPSPSCPSTCCTASSPDRQQCRCYRERCHPPRSQACPRDRNHREGQPVKFQPCPVRRRHRDCEGCKGALSHPHECLPGALDSWQYARGPRGSWQCCSAILASFFVRNLTCSQSTTRLSIHLVMYDLVVHQYPSLRHLQQQQQQQPPFCNSMHLCQTRCTAKMLGCRCKIKCNLVKILHLMYAILIRYQEHTLALCESLHAILSPGSLWSTCLLEVDHPG